MRVKMNKEINPHEMQMLSEYMDGQLPDKKRILLEKRLQSEPKLQETLGCLRRTSLMLKLLPVRRAPRNFFVTPEMVGKREPVRLFPAFRLASALASLLLIVVFAGDLIAHSSNPGTFSSANPQSRIASNDNSLAESNSPIIIWGTPTASGAGSEGSFMAAGVKGGNSTGDLSGELVGATPDSSIAGLIPQDTPQSPPLLGGGASQETVTPPENGLAQTPQATDLATLITDEEIQLENQSGPILGINPGGEGAATADLRNGSPAVISTEMILHLVEGFLGLVAVLSAITAFYFYRRDRA
jgi:hypothetical protein